MFARHASLAQRCTNTFITRKGGVTVEAVCGIKQATKQLPFLSTRTQIYRFHSSPTVRITADPKFSTRDDVTLLNTALQSLLRSARTGGRWVLTSNGQGLERSFKFKNFTRTWDFMTAVSLQCKLLNHHPEWSNVYNTTHIRWTTHNPPGLSGKDILLAEICDALASDFEEIVDVGDNGDVDTNANTSRAATFRQIADRAVKAAGAEWL